MLFSIVFCGYLLSKNRIPDGWSWAQDWSPANYAYEALVLNEFDGIDGLYVTSVVGENKVTAGPFTGEHAMHIAIHSWGASRLAARLWGSSRHEQQQGRHTWYLFCFI